MNNKEIEYKAYTLGDIKVIELLLLFRYKYDENMFLGEKSSFLSVSGVAPVNEEMIATYASLDQYIENCNFDVVQLKMLEMVAHGYTQEEIAEELEVFPSTIEGRLRTMYRAIARENERQWRKSVYEHKLGLKSKTCGRCEIQMPATVEFFSADSRNRDGFHSFCKSCRR